MEPWCSARVAAAMVAAADPIAAIVAAPLGGKGAELAAALHYQARPSR